MNQAIETSSDFDIGNDYHLKLARVVASGAGGDLGVALQDGRGEPQAKMSEGHLSLFDRVDVVVIDTGLVDWQLLRDGVTAPAEVVLVGGGDGLAQLAEALQGRTGIDAIHVLSHGFPGGFVLGSVTLDVTTLGLHLNGLAAIRRCLSDDAEILLYSCRTASGRGREFLAELAEITGAHVAGSYNLTGAAALGGDWELGYRSGSVMSHLPFTTALMAEYPHTLIPSTPVYSSSVAYIGEQTVELTFNVGLSETSPPLTSAFSVQINGTPVNVTSVTSSGTKVTLTLSGSLLTAGDIIEFTYTDPTAGNDLNAIQNTSGTDAATFSSSTIVYGGRPFTIPTLSAAGGPHSFIQGSTSGVDLFSSVTADANDTGQTFTGFTLTITNVSDTTEYIGGSLGSGVPLVNGGTGVVGIVGFGGGVATVTRSGTTATLTVAGISYTASSLIALIDGLTYSNSATSVTPGARVITLTNVTDSGGSNNTATPTGTAATVNVAAPPPVVYVAPTLSATGGPHSFIQGATSGVDLFSTVTADTNDTGQTITGFTLTVTNVSNSQEVISVSGQPGITLVLGGAGFIGVLGQGGGAGTVTISGTTATLTVTGLSYTASAFATLLDGLQYYNGATTVTPGARVITLTSVTDSGANHNTGTPTGTAATVNVAAELPPTLTATGNSPAVPAHSVNGVDLFSTVTASTNDVGQTFTGAVISVSGVTSSAEYLTIGGIDVALTNGNSVSLTGLGVSGGAATGLVAVTGGIATVTISSLSRTDAQMTALIDGLSYKNTSVNTLSSSRTVTIVSVTDSGPLTTSLSGITTTVTLPDTTSPAAPVISTPALSNLATPTISGTAETGATVSVTVGGATYATVATGGVWSLNLATATPISGTLSLNINGTNVVSTIAIDGASNASTATTQSLTIDTTAPAAPTVTSPALTNIAAPTLTGTAETGDTVTVTIAGATYTTTAIAGAWSVNLATATPSSGTLALNTNGSNAVSASAQDPAGNAAPSSATQALVIDTTAPGAPDGLTLSPGSDTDVLGDRVTSAVAPVITGTGVNGNTITLRNGNTVLGTAVVANGVWSITSTTLPIGTDTITATQTDPAGNVSVASSPLELTLTSPPAVTNAAFTPAGRQTVLFSGLGTDGNTYVWSTDGTAAGTQAISPVAFSNTPEGYNLVAGKVVFGGQSVNGHNGLWVTDGTPAGTHEITGIQGVSQYGFQPQFLFGFGAQVLFRGASTGGRTYLWSTDGTAAGTYQIATPGADTGAGLQPQQFARLNGRVIFQGDATGQNFDLWSTDGTTAGTYEITGVQGAGSVGNNHYGLSPYNLTAYNGRVLFRGVDSGFHRQLWTTDGTAAGTQVVAVQGASSTGFSPDEIFAYQGMLLIDGRNASNQYGLWTSDGTVGGTQELAVQGAASSGLSPYGFALFNDKVLFAGADTAGLYGLWVTDGTATGTHEIAVQGASPTDGLSPYGFKVANGVAVFSGEDAEGNYGLWTTDGTATGTYELSVQGASSGGFEPQNFQLVSLPVTTSLVAQGSVAGPLGVGRTITFTLTPSAAVTVTPGVSGPTLSLSDGGTATYDAAASTPTSLVFTTTVVLGQSTADLLVTGLALNGSTILDQTATPLDSSGLAELPGSDTGIVVDTVPPAAPAAITLAPASDTGVHGDNITSLAQPTISGTAAPNSTVRLYDGSTLIGSDVANGSGAWSVNPSVALMPGSNSLTATATNTLGSVSAASAVLIVTLDIPPVPTGLALAPGSDSGVPGDLVTNVSLPSLTGHAPANSTIRLYNGTTLIGTGLTDGNGVWTVTATTPLTSGLNSLSVTETNAAGNVSVPTASLAVTLETTVPNAPAITSPALTNTAAPVLTGTAEAGDTVIVTVAGATYVALATGGVWSLNLATAEPVSGTLALNTNGINTVSATGTNAVGTVSPAATQALTIDTAAPAAPLITSPALTHNLPPVVTGTAEDGDTVVVTVGGATYTTVATGGVWTIDLATAEPTSGTLALNINGINTVSATGTNAVGTVSPAATQALTIDTAAPAAPLITSPALTHNLPPVVTGTAEDGDTVVVRVGGATYRTVATGGVWTIDLATAEPTSGTLALNPNGSNAVSAGAHDPAGNASPTGTQTLTIDTTAPAAPLITSPALTHNLPPVLTGTAEDGDTVVVTVGGATYTTVATGGVWTIDLATAGPTSGTLALNPNGSNAVSAGAHDPAGNASPAGTQTLTIDTTAPAAPTITSPALTNTPAPVLTGTAEAGDTVTVIVAGALYTTVATGGVWSVNLATATPTSGTLALNANGSNAISVSAHDPAGNAAPNAATQTLTIDTVAPVAPAFTSPTPTSNPAPVLTGTAEAGDIVTVLVAGATYTTIATGGVWSISLTTATPTSGTLALNRNGPNTVSAFGTDLAGNASPRAIQALTIDTAAPAAPTLAQNTAVTNPAEPVLEGSAEPGSTVRLYQDGVQTATVTAADGSWNFTYPTNLAPGTYILTATATDTGGNVSAASDALTLHVAADNSYALVTPVPGTDTTQSFVYDPTGVLKTVQTNSGQGQVLTSVTSSAALINIYDTAGTLIGTITQPSTSLFHQPIFATSPETLAASTGSGPVGSVIDLLNETHNFVSEGNDQITVHAGTANITATGPAAVVTNMAAYVTFYGSTSGTASVYGGSGTVVAGGGGGGGTLIGGTAGHNVLAAGGGTTILVGAGEGDLLFGSSTGVDTLIGGAGAQTLVGGGGTETIVASSGDTAFGGAGLSTLFAGAAGGNTLVGGSGTSVLVADKGDTTLWGGTGHSTLWGGAGRDVMGGNAAINSVTVMVGGTGDATFIGSGGTSTAFGGAGNDTFWGGTGAMTIVAGSGQDTILFGSGVASVTGGSGPDLYGLISGHAGGTATIANFKVGVDHVAFYGYDVNIIQRQVSGGNTILTAADHSTVTLLGVTQLGLNSVT